MEQQNTAPFGTWPSPITPAMMTEKTVGLSGLKVDGDAVYWLESRPDEGGRIALVRWTVRQGIVDVTPAPISVASHVHEYGGGAYTASHGRIVYSEKKDGTVWLIDRGAAPRCLSAVKGCHFADFTLDLARNRVLAVREDHRDRPANDPCNSLVALPLESGDPSRTDGTVLVAGHDFFMYPRLSPDGGSLAWIAWDHPQMPWTATRLFTARLDRHGIPTTPEEIAPGLAQSIIQPAWSDDGRLHYLSDASDWWNLYRQGPEGPINLTPVRAEIGGPAWVFGLHWYELLPDGRALVLVSQDGTSKVALAGPTGISPLPFGTTASPPLPHGDGFVAIRLHTDRAPELVRFVDLTDGDGTILRRSSPLVLPPGSVSIAQNMTFATRDGATGQAFYYPPTHAAYRGADGAKPPLIVVSHGGPTGQNGPEFRLAYQWWTSRGFALLDVNYGGSTGYGRPYRERLNGQWGIIDVADCIAATETAIRRGYADPDRIAIRGGSAGGFTTLSALTQSNLFKAGASLYGVGDLMLLARDTHKFEARYMDGLIGPLPDATQIYRDRSPIHHLDRLTCPIIFFQGLDDKVVPANQAEAMVAAMRARGLPVAHYTFAGEGHGFRQAATIQRVLTLELGFYGTVFGFTPPDLVEAVILR